MAVPTMPRLLRRLVTFFVAFALCANASVAFAAGSRCCAGVIDLVATCHESAADALACSASIHELDDAGSACGEQCTSCATQQSTSPAAPFIAANAASALRSPFERTVLHHAAVPEARPERLERPPSLVL
jgi:hypothetical protein